jgi:hypothetical protein
MKPKKMPLEVLLSHPGVRDFHVWDDTSLVWLEDQDGIGCLKYRSGDGIERISSLADSVRGGILYGGGEFAVRDSKVVFCANRNRLVAWVNIPMSLLPLRLCGGGGSALDITGWEVGFIRVQRWGK